MTTVQEELEQSTEDIANATEETLQRKPELTVVNDKRLTDSHNDLSINHLTSNAKERLGYDKDTISVHSSKDNFNNQCRPHSATKVNKFEYKCPQFNQNLIRSLYPCFSKEHIIWQILVYL